MSLPLFGLLLCLPVLAFADHGERQRFLARSQPEGQSHERRLEEQPKSEGEQCGAGGSDDCAIGFKCVSNTCHKVCGVFGPSREKVFYTCNIEGQTCSGKAPTPCSVGDGECYMYCDSADRRLWEQPKSEGEQCGAGGSDDCAMGLKCVSNTCHKVCGVFDPSREKVFYTCDIEGQTCSGKAPTPCSLGDGECYMYCDSADRRLEEQSESDLHL